MQDGAIFSNGFKAILPVQFSQQKYFPSRLTRLSSRSLAVLSPEGRSRVVTNAGRDAVDAAASARCGTQGGLRLVSGLAGARTNGARRVRRSRVVLASVADVKPAEAKSARPGLAKP
jgi:hypothetical protein